MSASLHTSHTGHSSRRSADAAARAAAGTPRCPRCLYDLSGTVSAWTIASPVRARCSECGFDCDTAECFPGTRRHATWNPEGALDMLALVARSIALAWAPFVPFSRWHAQRLVITVDWGRLVLAVLLCWATWLTAATLLLGGLVHVDPGIALAVTRFVDALFGGAYGSLLPVIHPVDAMRASFLMILAFTLPILALHLATYVGIVFVPTSRHRARVAWRHVGRFALVGLTVPILPSIFAVAIVLGSTQVRAIGFASDVLVALGSLPIVLPPALALAWWWAGCREHFRLTHALGIAVANTAIGSLAWLLVVVVTAVQ